MPSGSVNAEFELNVTASLPVLSVPKFTVASGTGAPLVSVTVALAVDVDVPSLRIDDGVSVSETFPTVCGPTAHRLLIGTTSATRRPASASPQKRRDVPRPASRIPMVPPQVPVISTGASNGALVIKYVRQSPE